MSMNVTEDKMFAIEDNTDDEDMMDYHGKRAKTLGLDISEIPIVEIKNMKLIDADGIETIVYDSKLNEDLWKM